MKTDGLMSCELMLTMQITVENNYDTWENVRQGRRLCNALLMQKNDSHAISSFLIHYSCIMLSKVPRLPFQVVNPHRINCSEPRRINYSGYKVLSCCREHLVGKQRLVGVEPHESRSGKINNLLCWSYIRLVFR